MSIVKQLTDELDEIVSKLDKLTEPINKIRSESKDSNMRIYGDSLYGIVNTIRANATLLRTLVSIKGSRITPSEVEDAKKRIANLKKIVSSINASLEVILKT